MRRCSACSGLAILVQWSAIATAQEQAPVAGTLSQGSPGGAAGPVQQASIVPLALSATPTSIAGSPLLTVAFTQQLADTLSSGWNANVTQQCQQAAASLLLSISSGAIASDTAVPGNVVACYNLAAWEPSTGFFAGDVRLYSLRPAQATSNVGLKLSFGKLATIRSFTDSKNGTGAAPLAKRQILDSIQSAFASLTGGSSKPASSSAPKSGTASGKSNSAKTSGSSSSTSSSSTKSNTSPKTPPAPNASKDRDAKPAGSTASTTTGKDKAAKPAAAAPAPVKSTPKAAPPPAPVSPPPAPVSPPPAPVSPPPAPVSPPPARPATPATSISPPAGQATVASPASGLNPIEVQGPIAGAAGGIAPAAILPSDRSQNAASARVAQQLPQQQQAAIPERLSVPLPDRQQPQQQLTLDASSTPQEVERFQFLALANLPAAAADASGEGLFRAMVPSITLLVTPAGAASTVTLDLAGRTAGFVTGIRAPRGPFVPLTGYFTGYRGIGGKGGTLPGRVLMGLDGSVSRGSIAFTLAWFLTALSSFIFGVCLRFNKRQSYRKLKLRY